MQIIAEVPGRVGGVELFEGILHVGLRGSGGVSFRNMHSQCFGEIKVQRMQLMEETARGVWGLHVLRNCTWGIVWPWRSFLP